MNRARVFLFLLAAVVAFVMGGPTVAAMIRTGTITANEIAARTITANQIAAGTLTANEIAAGTITSDKIAAHSIAADRLNVSSLSAISANLGTVTAGTIDGATISAGTGDEVVLNSNGLTIADYTSSGNSRLKWSGGSYVVGYTVGGSGGLTMAAPGTSSLMILSANQIQLQGQVIAMTGTEFTGGGAQVLCVDNNGQLYAQAGGC